MIASSVLLIGCARSGTTLLYTVLSEVDALWSLGYESRAIIERDHSPATRGWDSGALTADDLTPAAADDLRRAFAAAAVPGAYWRHVNRLRRGLNGTRLYRALKRRGRSGSVAAAAAALAHRQADPAAARHGRAHRVPSGRSGWTRGSGCPFGCAQRRSPAGCAPAPRRPPLVGAWRRRRPGSSRWRPRWWSWWRSRWWSGRTPGRPRRPSAPASQGSSSPQP